MSQIDYDTSKANAIKSSWDTLLRESRIDREELIKAAQEEQEKETTNDANKDKLRNETAARILYYLQKNTFPAVVTGTRESSDEPFIYENKLQAILQETRDKQAKLEQLQDTIAKVTKEETRVREELNRFTIEAEKEHGPLATNLVTLDEKYKVLADLEL